LATFLISNIVTNNAAAALIFPIAMNAAEQIGSDVELMSYCVMLGASASFMSPFGYTYVFGLFVSDSHSNESHVLLYILSLEQT
jgi:di/tricarboxylate transporter